MRRAVKGDQRAMAVNNPASNGRGAAPSSLAEVLDRILDKGIVIDAWVRVALLGIELLTIEARVVVASVETYLKVAQAIGQSPLASQPQTLRSSVPSMTLPAS